MVRPSAAADGLLFITISTFTSMLNTKVVELWHTTFKKMGYEETKYNNWFKETKELIVVLRVLTLPGNPEFFVDVGLIIKKLYHHGTLQRPVWRYCHLGQSLWRILYLRSENKRTERYLNKLFSFDPKINTDDQIESNISKLSMMYSSRSAPLFNKLDYWLGEDEDFNEKSTWLPFYKYFEPTGNVDRCLW